MKSTVARFHARALCSAVICLMLALADPVSAQGTASVSVIGLDYAFQAPDTLAAGPTAFGFENRGQMRHEMIIYRLRVGVSPDSMLHADPLARRTLTETVGILLADPRNSALGRVLVDLSPGRTYVLVCSLQDAPDKPRHLTLGMVHVLRVPAR